MKSFFICLILLLNVGAANVIAASPQDAVMSTLHQFMDGFNRNDAKTALAACAGSASIVDEFPPHEWQGPRACEHWANALDADNAKHGITGGVVTLAKPLRVDVTGDRAYAVVPANYTYKQNGKPVNETNSLFTVALVRTSAGWRITGWAWSKR